LGRYAARDPCREFTPIAGILRQNQEDAMKAIQTQRIVKLGKAKRLTRGGGDHGFDFKFLPMEPQG
jgi:hypothetical protein